MSTPTLETRVAALESLVGALTGTSSEQQASARIDQLEPFGGVDEPGQFRLGISNTRTSTSEQADGNDAAVVLNGIVQRENNQAPIYGKMNNYPDSGFCDFRDMADGQAFAITVAPGESVTIDNLTNFWDLDNSGGTHDAVWIITQLAGSVRFLIAGNIPPAQP